MTAVAQVTAVVQVWSMAWELLHAIAAPPAPLHPKYWLMDVSNNCNVMEDTQNKQYTKMKKIANYEKATHPKLWILIIDSMTTG